MNARSFLNGLKSRPVRLILYLVGLVLVLFLVARLREDHEVPTLVKDQGETGSPSDLQASVTRPMEPFRPPSTRPERPAPAAPTTLRPRVQPSGPPPPVQEPRKPPVVPLSLVSASGEEESALGEKPVEADAPFGRLVLCETVITVDSSRIQTPVIGLVTEDVHYLGRLVIPAGTEVHGTAQQDHSRDRIASGNAWTLVWQSGQELDVRALALDREFESATNLVGWGITDGSAGLRGRIIKSDAASEAKLFLASILRGAASALTERELTLLGSIDSRSLNNAPLRGADEVLRVYSQRVLESIEREGYFVRIPTGKEFYLYLLEPVVLENRRHRDMGGAENW